MTDTNKIRKFWLRGPDQYKETSEGRKFVGRGRPVTLVAWRMLGENTIAYTRVTHSPVPDKKTGKPDVFSRKKANDDATYGLLYSGRGEVFHVVKPAAVDAQVAIVAHIADTGRPGTQYVEAAEQWLFARGIVRGP